MLFHGVFPFGAGHGSGQGTATQAAAEFGTDAPQLGVAIGIGYGGARAVWLTAWAASVHSPTRDKNTDINTPTTTTHSANSRREAPACFASRQQTGAGCDDEHLKIALTEFAKRPPDRGYRQAGFIS
jgi:hypothetical protein